jgi:hypothetical protein
MQQIYGLQPPFFTQYDMADIQTVNLELFKKL